MSNTTIYYGPDLERWKEVAIPAWQKVLKESQEAGNTTREQYAKWMLDEVLEVTNEPG